MLFGFASTITKAGLRFFFKKNATKQNLISFQFERLCTPYKKTDPVSLGPLDKFLFKSFYFKIPSKYSMVLIKPSSN